MGAHHLQRRQDEESPTRSGQSRCFKGGVHRIDDVVGGLLLSYLSADPCKGGFADIARKFELEDRAEACLDSVSKSRDRTWFTGITKIATLLRQHRLLLRIEKCAATVTSRSFEWL